MLYGYDVVIYGDAYKVLDREGYYDYDWSEVALLRREDDGALFVAEDSGCSCTTFGDNVSFIPVFSLSEGNRVFRKEVRRLYNY